MSDATNVAAGFGYSAATFHNYNHLWISVDRNQRKLKLRIIRSMEVLKISGIVFVGFLSLTMVAACSKTSDQKMADAKADLNEVVEDIEDAVDEGQDAARDEWLKFKEGYEAKIDANEKVIAEYKSRMTGANGKMQAKFEKKIDDLEKRNRVLKAKLNDYKSDGKTAWEQFKSEFDHDIDELGVALKDFVVNNKK